MNQLQDSLRQHLQTIHLKVDNFLTGNTVDHSWTTSFADAVYHAAVISGITITYSLLAKTLIKMRSVDLGRLDVEDAAKLVLLVTGAVVTRDYLVKEGIIPGHI